MLRVASYPQSIMIDYIKNKIKGRPVVGVVLGSGLQELSSSLENAAHTIPRDSIIYQYNH